MTFLPDTPVLIAYTLACLVLFITPGPDMSLFLAKTVAAGRRAGIAAWRGWTTGASGWEGGGSRAGRVGAEEESQDAPRYVKGERVRHRRFGGGVIQGLQGVGKDLRVTVAFDDGEVGVKQLLVAYAGLERDWEGA